MVAIAERLSVGPDNPLRLRKEFAGVAVEGFSQGKRLSGNEDKFIVNPRARMIGVIDGASAKSPFKFNGVTGGEFASSTIAGILNSLEEPLFGEELIETLTAKFNEKLDPLLFDGELARSNFVRPSAALTLATLVGDKIMVTQLSDVAFCLNGDREKIYNSPIAVDDQFVKERINALWRAMEQDPNISVKDFLKTGVDSYVDLLQLQGEEYENNPNHPLGYGAIDGRPIPKKFIKVYEFDAKEVQTLEIFSDGYFKQGNEPTIDSWEEAFREVEREDPYKILKYQGVKGSLPGVHWTDDRTLLIANFN